MSISLGVFYLPAILLISIIWALRLGLLASVVGAVAFGPIPILAQDDQDRPEHGLALLGVLVNLHAWHDHADWLDRHPCHLPPPRRHPGTSPRRGARW